MSRLRFRGHFLVSISTAALLLAAAPLPESDSWLASYRSWRPLLQEVKPVPYELWTLCMTPSTEQWQEARKKHGPHSKYFIQVYANPVAAKALRSDPGKPLPVGSVIAKDKLTNPRTADSDGVAFMVKRADTRFKASGGWEFLYFPTREGGPRVAADACADCHRTADHDYIKGIYPFDAPPALGPAKPRR